MRFYFGKIWKSLEKRPFFRADMAGLGKYCTGGYGRIGVYRVKAVSHSKIKQLKIRKMKCTYRQGFSQLSGDTCMYILNIIENMFSLFNLFQFVLVCRFLTIRNIFTPMGEVYLVFQILIKCFLPSGKYLNSMKGGYRISERGVPVTVY